MSSPRLLHVDIETAPMKAYTFDLWHPIFSIEKIAEPDYILSWSAKWEGESKILYAGLNTHTKRQMLKGIYRLLEQCDSVVHYNGVRFDVPMLNREFALLGLAPPRPFHQIDLYKTVKKNFKFPSNKLAYVAERFGIGSKVQHKGFPLWIGCMEGDEESWQTMERYNKQDVVLVSRLYRRLLPWIKNHPNHGLYTDLSRPRCTNCGSSHVQRRGMETTKTGVYKRFKCSDCGTPLRGRLTQTPKARRKNILIGG